MAYPRTRVGPVLVFFLLAFGACQSETQSRKPVTPAGPEGGPRVSSPEGPLEVVDHGREGEGHWIRYRSGPARRELHFGRERLPGGGQRVSLRLLDRYGERAVLEVDPASQPDRFVPRLWVVEDGRRRRVELDPLPGLARPPRVRLPRAAEMLVREAAVLLGSERVQRELLDGVLEKPPTLVGSADCARAWQMVTRTCIDPSTPHECTYWVVKLISCIVIALAWL